MVNIGNRMRKLKTLLDIRNGPGAAILPHNVKKIHLEFNFKMNGGHLGARKFWRNALPRLKYHNPTVSMVIDRTNIEDGPATLTIQFEQPASTTSESSSTTLLATRATVSPTEESTNIRAEIIDMKNIRDSEILSQLMKITNAVQVFPSAKDEAELRKLNKAKEKSRQDSLANLRHREKEKERENLLAMAREIVAE